MPPKKSVKATAASDSDGDATSSATGGTGGGLTIPASDLEFIQQCLTHVVGDGSIVIDCAAVASARGQSNPRSIANRIATIKRKYQMPFVAGNTSGNASTSNTGAADSSPAKIPPTPRGPKRKSTNLIKTPASKAKKGKGGKKVAVQPDSEEEYDAAEAGADTEEVLEVETQAEAEAAEKTEEEMLYDGVEEYTVNEPNEKIVRD